MRPFALARIIIAAALMSVGFAAPSARADVKVHSLFTSEAVLQQGMKIPIFGTADEGESVSVRIQDQEASTVAEGGKWEVELGPLKPGGPFQLTVTGNRRVAVHNVLVGEVWICAGGSNMQWTLINTEGGASHAIVPENKRLRLCTIRREPATEPRDTLDATWIQAGASSVGHFSAVGYYFGRGVLKSTDVPVGLISCNQYRSTVESWISKEALEKAPALKKHLERPISSTDERSPTVFYNAMVHPLTRYAVRGVIWYHGENALETAQEYRDSLPVLIADWRARWKQPKLPFLIVQLAPYRNTPKNPGESKLAELRESQLVVWKQTEKTALIVTTEFGDRYDPNPRRKQPIGERLALAADAIVYGKSVEYMGPIFDSMSISRNEATLKFRHLGTGLTKKGDDLTGFAVAGPDRVFHEAKAAIKGSTVVVSSDQVPLVEAVRYGWADYPNGNLFNAEGLPASPFRTDNYPLLSGPQSR